ncbi:leucine--tRNA ligase [Saccharomycopsis crataegensis]|uniref:leucine--tRNA ligase n=1 Tax=Saccharomycopsis crataegensis TaxID=43959 RepID=A0AAV5QFK0_9ASCO|nr:leucine--tRNA ligase [Saccharomycopsis crataegensis]
MVAAAPASGTPLVLENTSKRDALIEIEKKYQKKWQEDKVFEVDAPTIEQYEAEIEGDTLRDSNPKYFASMAYPYMNGRLHLGHGFTLSKAEFTTGFQRMNYKEGSTPRRALFPLGFHCTGMPIKSAADKIARELEMFGQNFEKFFEEQESETQTEKKEEVTKANEDVSKFKAKKAKAVQKQGGKKYQFQIIQQLDVPLEEIHKFADPMYWLYYFPPHTQSDVVNFGGRVDWRRSMITTDVNPYYDSFIRWSINKMRDLGKIKFGERYTIYSEKDGQACMDHDRQSGEGVGPQEYTGIKIELMEYNDEVSAVFKENNFDVAGKKVFLVAATLRPETMYGQTCCFVSPKIDYGLFDAGNGEYFITTERAFKNMCYQKLTPKRGFHTPVLSINGKALIGSKIHAPLAIHKELRVLPMETILPNKGTGVVTCVPSDSPDDYVTMKDLFNKSEYYKIDQSWADVEAIPVINTEKYGDLTAKTLVEQLKIQSPKDAVQLAKAKEAAYKEGYFNGKMIIGSYIGEKVESAKPKVKADLIASGEAFVYNEPESLVMSRSNDECIVSLEDQWYVDYGEENWKARALEALHGMRTFSAETTHGFEGVLDWLKNWALTRSYGLGTRLPWDESLLIESLSDSTIYQAFYTLAHMLHSDFYGKEPGLLNIKPEQMTEDVWEYIFLRKENIETDIPLKKLQIMRREFEFFYPLDESISGKDLIPNHLTFWIYTNVAIYPKKFWPGGVRANGHLLLNNAKMSKSTGNFYTLQQIVDKYGADASRIALADSGDSIEDANFDEQNASAAILRLFTLKEWAEDIVKNVDNLRNGPIQENFFDLAFENEMNALIEECYKNYDETNYKFALKAGLFDFQSARDYYVDICGGVKNVHRDLILRYIKAQSLLLAPIAPHIAEYIVHEILGEKDLTVHSIAFPRATKPVDIALSDALEYIRSLARSIRETELNALKPKKGKNAKNLDINKSVNITLYIALTFPEWQDKYLTIVRELFEAHTLDDNKVVKTKIEGKDMKKVMPFVSGIKARLTKESPEIVFNRKLTFDELEIVKTCLNILKICTAKVTVNDLNVITFNNGEDKGKNLATGEEVELPKVKAIEAAVPGQPGIVIDNV